MEVAVFAMVEIVVDGFTANVANPVGSRRNKGVANHVSELVAVEEGGEFVGVAGVGEIIHRGRSRRMVVDTFGQRSH